MKYRYLDGLTNGVDSWEEKTKINTWSHKPSEELASDSGDDELFWKKRLHKYTKFHFGAKLLT